jgi:hypothetical protein
LTHLIDDCVALPGSVEGGNEMTEKTNETIQLKDSERQPCEVWTRVMGYHRPVQSFNIGKKGEFEERKYFVESKCGCGTSK